MGPIGRGGQADEAVEVTGVQSFIGVSTVSMDVFWCKFVFSTGNGRVVLVPLGAMIQREEIKLETEVKFFLLFLGHVKHLCALS
jgi:hypothetical protein